MQLYDAVVRLNGNPMQEVPKEAMTASEIILLQKIHGGTDAVVKIRNRLGLIYGDNHVFSLFGPEHTKLPVKLENIDFVESDELTDDDLDLLTAPDRK